MNLTPMEAEEYRDWFSRVLAPDEISDPFAGRPSYPHTRLPVLDAVAMHFMRRSVALYGIPWETVLGDLMVHGSQSPAESEFQKARYDDLLARRERDEAAQADEESGDLTGGELRSRGESDAP